MTPTHIWTHPQEMAREWLPITTLPEMMCPAPMQALLPSVCTAHPASTITPTSLQRLSWGQAMAFPAQKTQLRKPSEIPQVSQGQNFTNMDADVSPAIDHPLLFLSHNF